jgi:hypothetical protein
MRGRYPRVATGRAPRVVQTNSSNPPGRAESASRLGGYTIKAERKNALLSIRDDIFYLRSLQDLVDRPLLAHLDVQVG